MEDMLLHEKNIEVQDAIVAAMNELEAWDNHPCSVQVNGEVLPSYYIAEAKDPFLCCDCLVPALCPCHCHKE